MSRANKWRMVASAIVLISLSPASASAQRNYTDTTGTNIWNNTAPLIRGNGIDPELVARVNRLNQEAQEVYTACNVAIAEIEQQGDPKPRRFARKPAPPPPLPQACGRLEELRSEAETLRQTLTELQKAGGNAARRTW